MSPALSCVSSRAHVPARRAGKRRGRTTQPGGSGASAPAASPPVEMPCARRARSAVYPLFARLVLGLGSTSTSRQDRMVVVHALAARAVSRAVKPAGPAESGLRRPLACKLLCAPGTARNRAGWLGKFLCESTEYELYGEVRSTITSPCRDGALLRPLPAVGLACPSCPLSGQKAEIRTGLKHRGIWAGCSHKA